MSMIEAILQGIVQGLTEFLPVSSSGHLSLFQHFTGLNGESAVTMTIVFHLGTLAAVFIAFWDKIKALVTEAFGMIGDIFTGKFKWKEMNPLRRMIVMIIISILPLFGFYIFKDFFEGLQEDSDIIAEGCCFLYTSALLFLSGRYGRESGSRYAEKKTTVGDALTIGVFQGVALLPGVSRSGSTISAALFTGMKREDAVEYSFILGIPVILAAAAVNFLDALKDSVPAERLKADIIPLLIGFAVSAAAGYFAIRLIKMLVTNDKFHYFAWYTLVLGIAVLGVGIYERANGTHILFTLNK